MSKKYVDDALELIGNTPVIRLHRIVPEDAAEVYVKLENFNAGGSIKDRTALSMIEGAEKEGLISPGKTTLVESTSGNTGVGLALAAALKGYRLIIVMSEAASVERRQLMQAYGAELVLVPPSDEGILADFKVQDELAAKPGYFSLRQFENRYNPLIHEKQTGPELVDQIGSIPDAFTAGAGTGGTLSGIARYLKSQDPNVHIAAVEPAGSPVLNGGKAGMHRIAGIGSGIIPKTLDRSVIDEVLDITDEQAENTARRLAKEEGLLLGPSSGAAVYAAIELAKRLGPGHKVAAVAPDTGERYLSTGLFDPEKAAGEKAEGKE